MSRIDRECGLAVALPIHRYLSAQPHKVYTYVRPPPAFQLPLAATSPRSTRLPPNLGAAHHGRSASPPTRRTRRRAAADCTDAQMPRNAREAHGRIEMQVSNCFSSPPFFSRSALTDGEAQRSYRNYEPAAWGQNSTMSCIWRCLMR